MNQSHTHEDRERLQSVVVSSLSERINYAAAQENRSVSSYIAMLLDKHVPMIPAKPKKTRK